MASCGQLRMAGAMTEGELQGLVTAMCRTFGLYCYHTHDSRHSAAGFPDLVILGGRAALFRELKRDDPRAKLSLSQTHVIALMRNAGLNVGVWRPVDWVEQRIHDELIALRATMRS